jgi:hypothetical protein
MVAASEPIDLHGNPPEYAAFGSIRTIADTLKRSLSTDPPVSLPGAFYAYGDEERSLCVSSLQSLLGDVSCSLQDAPVGDLALRVSDEMTDLTGPMAGLNFPLRLTSEDAVLTGVSACGNSMPATVISAGDAPVFLRFQKSGVPVFLSTSSHMVDIDQPVGEPFYDVKKHFCSVVPLLLFVRFMFPDIAWRPQELGACLIIDDPLLKPRYGCCDFVQLRDLMREHKFTTNIAFIPWNWRRTSPAAREFFGNESGFFSVSIHGCDHTGGEFGATSLDVLDSRARLAQSRMRNHESRTGIQHDSIMVFPQGVFSSACPEVLKQSDYVAAVNTEINPVDSLKARTRIRDVWDVAIMTYGAFPIFTRRYAFHGIENFAFDLLLGKPCLIVAHHDSFKDGGASMVELIKKIGSLNCCLHWRPLGEVIRRACRLRADGEVTEELEMYGNELLVANSTNEAIEIKIRKRKSKDDFAFEIICDGKPTTWTTGVEHVIFGGRIPPHSEIHFQVLYPKNGQGGKERRTLRFEVAVAVRRILSEFRDGYLS